MDYEKKYNEALERASKLRVQNPFDTVSQMMEHVFPELADSEDERIRKGLIEYFKDFRLGTFAYLEPKKILAWLEKQGTPAKLSEEEQNRFAKGVLSSCALSFIDYLDAHKYEGKMCVSNGECEDIENAFHNAMWERLHRYYCKYIEKQGEQILANSVKTCKDEKKPYGKREECYDCQMNYGGTCKGSCAMKRGEQKPADKVEHKRMTKLEDKLSSLVVNAVHIYCKENELDTPHYVGLILGDRLAKEWSQDILTLAKDELKMTEQEPAETVKWSPQEESCICQLESLVKEQWRQAERTHNSVNIKKMSELMFFLKTLNPNKKPQGIISAEAKEAMYNKPAWSEEDEREIEHCIDFLNHPDMIRTTPTVVKGCKNWLKSLRPQTTWKPSEDQITVLHDVAAYFDNSICSIQKDILVNLYLQLKKLREE